MKKGVKIFLLVSIITIIMISVSIILVHNCNVFKENQIIEEIINNQDLEKIEQKEIKYDDIIGTLTIPDILLENAPIRESTDSKTLNEAIGHFTSTNIYLGNVGLASHNTGETGDFFRNLKSIQKGSEIFYQTDYGTKRYIVEIKEIIEETDFSYLQKTEDNRITLITCVHNQPSKRLCVQAVENYDNMNYGQ